MTNLDDLDDMFQNEDAMAIYRRIRELENQLNKERHTVSNMQQQIRDLIQEVVVKDLRITDLEGRLGKQNMIYLQLSNGDIQNIGDSIRFHRLRLFSEDETLEVISWGYRDDYDNKRSGEHSNE